LVKVNLHVNFLLFLGFAKSGQNRTLSHFIQTLFTDETIQIMKWMTRLSKIATMKFILLHLYLDTDMETWNSGLRPFATNK